MTICTWICEMLSTSDTCTLHCRQVMNLSTCTEQQVRGVRDKQCPLPWVVTIPFQSLLGERVTRSLQSVFESHRLKSDVAWSQAMMLSCQLGGARAK